MSRAIACDWWLALDQGGHASRAMVFDATGQLVTQAFAAIHTQRHGEQVEHDPEELAQSLRLCLQDIAASLSGNVRRIAAAGLATQRSSIVCWHRATGAALSPVLSWQDRRYHVWLNTLAPQRALIERTTGLVLSPHYGASKLRWCLDHLPEVQRAQNEGQLCCGPLSSYLLYALLIEHPFYADPGNASRTQLWSPATRDWSPELLSLFDIPRAALPSCVPTRHDYGHVLLGDQPVPLHICTGDQAAVPFAHGALRFDSIYLNLGTGAFALAPLQHDQTDAAPLLRSVLWSDANQSIYALEGTVNGAAAALDWYAQQSGHDVERISNHLDRARVDGLSIPLFINGIGGVGSPFWIPELQTGFLPEQTLHDPTLAMTQVAAIIESIAFLIDANLSVLRSRLPQLSRLVLGGGLAQCQYLCDCLGALCDLPILRLSERELTAKGLAFLIADQPDHWTVAPGNALLASEPHVGLHDRRRRWREIMATFS